jgi:DNA (cytosine-5)-methyltransferase 1
LDQSAIADGAFLRARAVPPLEKYDSEIRVVDLFCGIGGMSVGAAEACRALGLRFESALACDISASALSAYARNLNGSDTERADLQEVSSLMRGAPTPVEIRLFRNRGEIDLFLAGPPCQGHSNLNNHTRRLDPKNELYLKMARAVSQLMPRFVLIENVPAVMRDHLESVPRTAAALESQGYRVDSGIVDMSRIGVPQTRKRHVLVGIRNDQRTGFQSIEASVRAFEVNRRDLSWAIGDLVDCRRESLFDEVPGMSELTRARIDHLFEQDLFELPDDQRPECHRDGDHSYGAVYGRMKWTEPAPTITGGFFTMGRGRFVHPSRRSTITAHEAARLQFFPDWFDFSCLTTRKELASAIGNAVPPKLSYIFALELLR